MARSWHYFRPTINCACVCPRTEKSTNWHTLPFQSSVSEWLNALLIYSHWFSDAVLELRKVLEQIVSTFYLMGISRICPKTMDMEIWTIALRPKIKCFLPGQGQPLFVVHDCKSFHTVSKPGPRVLGLDLVRNVEFPGFVEVKELITYKL